MEPTRYAKRKARDHYRAAWGSFVSLVKELWPGCTVERNAACVSAVRVRLYREDGEDGLVLYDCPCPVPITRLVRNGRRWSYPRLSTRLTVQAVDALKATFPPASFSLRYETVRMAGAMETTIDSFLMG